MKQKILEALKTKYAKLGFGQKAFDGVADYLSKTVTKEEDIETAIAGVEGLLKAFQSDADKTRTEKSEAERKLAELEAKVKALGGAPDDKDEPDNKGGDDKDVPAWAKALVDANKALTERLNKLDVERTATTRKKQLSEIIGKLPESLRKGYERIAVDTMTEDEFNALKEETGKEVEAIASEMKSKGAVFGRPGARAGNQRNDTLTKEQLEAIEKRDGTAADGQQPF